MYWRFFRVKTKQRSHIQRTDPLSCYRALNVHPTTITPAHAHTGKACGLEQMRTHFVKGSYHDCFSYSWEALGHRQGNKLRVTQCCGSDNNANRAVNTGLYKVTQWPTEHEPVKSFRQTQPSLDNCEWEDSVYAHRIYNAGRVASVVTVCNWSSVIMWKREITMTTQENCMNKNEQVEQVQSTNTVKKTISICIKTMNMAKTCSIAELCRVCCSAVRLLTRFYFFVHLSWYTHRISTVMWYFQ